MDNADSVIFHVIITFLVDVRSSAICIGKHLLERGNLENLYIRTKPLNFEDSCASLFAEENLGAVGCFEQMNMSVIRVSGGR